MSTENDIFVELRKISGAKYENLCNGYFKESFPDLTPSGLCGRKESSIKGEMDAFCIRNGNQLIAFQYSSQEKGWESKLFGGTRSNPFGDAQKVSDNALRNKLDVEELYFCTIEDINQNKQIEAENKAKIMFGFPIKIYGIKRLSADLSCLYPGLAHRFLEVPIALQYFTMLEDYLSRSRSKWSHWEDTERGRIYVHEYYLKILDDLLARDPKWALVEGLSASGKSMLALAYALRWREIHPGAPILFLVITGIRTWEMGLEWYREVVETAYKNTLVIIDNCHLATDAIFALCEQWMKKAAPNVRLLLLSRPCVPDAGSMDAAEDNYLDDVEFLGLLKDQDCVLRVCAEDIFEGVLRKHAESMGNVYADQLDTELKNEQQYQKIMYSCGHNLVAARCFLQAWNPSIEHLSEVDEISVLKQMRNDPFLRGRNNTTSFFCALGQFEILAHCDYVERYLPQSDIKSLLADRELFTQVAPSGDCYFLSCHPQTAALLFRADVYRRKGQTYMDYVDKILLQIIKEYLNSIPPNINDVYHKLYRSNRQDMQHCLLCDSELQETTVAQFGCLPFDEVAKYMRLLSYVDINKLRNLLEYNSPADWAIKVRGTSLNTITNLFLSMRYADYDLNMRKKVAQHLDNNELNKYMAEASLYNIYWFVRELSPFIKDTLHTLLESIPPETLAEKASGVTLGGVRNLFKTLMMADCGKAYKQDIAQHLNTTCISTRVYDAELQPNYWFIRDLSSLAPKKAREILEAIPPEKWAQKASSQKTKNVSDLFRAFAKAGCGLTFRREVVRHLNSVSVSVAARETGMQTLHWLMRDIVVLNPEKAKEILEAIPPEKLAENASQDVLKNVLSMLVILNKAECSKHFQNDVIEQLDFYRIMTRSPLGHIGLGLRYYPHIILSYYQKWRSAGLECKIRESTLKEVAKFIAKLRDAPDTVKALGDEVLEYVLLDSELAERIADSDVEILASLIYSTYELNPQRTALLMMLPGMENAMVESLAKSQVKGVQMLLHNLAQYAPNFLPTTAKRIRELDFTASLFKAQIIDIAYFLHNVHAYVEPEIAQKYCTIVDAQKWDNRHIKTKLADLVNLLWNMVHIGNVRSILVSSETMELFRNSWTQEIPACVTFLGLLDIAAPELLDRVEVPKLTTKAKTALSICLEAAIKKQDWFTFALTVRGLHNLKSDWFEDVIAKYREDWRLRLGLKIVLDPVHTPNVTHLSRILLEDTAKYICLF